MTLTPEEVGIVLLSLKVAVAAVVCTLPLGIALGAVLARGRFIGKSVLESVVQLPLVMPPVVTGYVLLLLFGRRGPIGAWLYEHFGVSIAFTWQGAALAAAIMGLPLMVRAIRLSMAQVDARLEQAASTLGAGPARVFLTVTLPLAAPGVITGAILSFARSLGEFGATITFVGNIEGETRTLPLALYTYTQSVGGEGPALRLVVISAVVAFAALWLSEWLTNRAERGTRSERE